MTSELSDGWISMPLGNFRSGKTKNINPADTPDEIFELYSVPSFSEGSPEIISGSEIGSSKRIVEPNTVLLCKINPRINRVWIIGNHSTNRQISSPEWVEFLPTEEVEPKYLMYFMQNQKFREYLCMNVSGVGGSLTRVRPQIVEQYEIPIAPPEQQKRIVAKIEELFSHIDAGIKALKKAKQLLKQYRQSVLKAAVTGELTKEWREANKDKLEPASQLLQRILKERRQKWEEQQFEKFKVKGKMPKDGKWKEKYKEPEEPVIHGLPKILDEWVWATLPQLGELSRGKSKHRPRNNPSLYGGDYPFVQTGDVRAANAWLNQYSQTYSNKGLAQSRLWPKGTMCITIAANIADTALLGFDACFPDSVVGFIPIDSSVNVEVIELFIRTLKGDLEKYAPATAQKNINLHILETVAIPLPPKEEQFEIGHLAQEKFDSIERLDIEIEHQINKARRNKQSVLSAAFTGNYQ